MHLWVSNECTVTTVAQDWFPIVMAGFVVGQQRRFLEGELVSSLCSDLKVPGS